MGTVVSEGKDLRWKISMMSKLPQLKAKQFACLEYLMVRFPSFYFGIDEKVVLVLVCGRYFICVEVWFSTFLIIIVSIST